MKNAPASLPRPLRAYPTGCCWLGLCYLPTAAVAAAKPDPIFAVIENHRHLSASCDAAVAISAIMANDGPDFEAADAVAGQRQQLLIDHANALICCEPTTLAGAVALMRYVASLDEWQEPVDRRDGDIDAGSTSSRSNQRTAAYWA